MRDLKEKLQDHVGLVFGISYKIVRNREDAEDIVQEAYTDLAKQLEKGIKIRNFKAFLARISYNKSLHKRRSIAIHKKSLEIIASKSSGVITMEKERQIQDLKDSISELPEEEQLILSLSYTHELSYDEIADTLDSSKATISRRLSSIKDRLREKLVPAGFTVSNTQIVSAIKSADAEESRLISKILYDKIDPIISTLGTSPLPAILKSLINFSGGTKMTKLLLLLVTIGSITGIYILKPYLYQDGNPTVVEATANDNNKRTHTRGHLINGLR